MTSKQDVPAIFFFVSSNFVLAVSHKYFQHFLLAGVSIVILDNRAIHTT
jgi:hypothetical protein